MKRSKNINLSAFIPMACVLLIVLIVGVGTAGAQNSGLYEVTITNLTRGQQFTPILVATHREGVNLFELGSAASPALEALAENGNTDPLMNMLGSNPGVFDMGASSGLLDPGMSVTVRVRGGVANAHNFSVASMLIPTNDGFLAINGGTLPRGRAWMTLASPAYDSGTERNDELCDSIPGPNFDECGGPGSGGAPAGDEEGYVHVHSGIHGTGDLVPAVRDWRNPVARISVRRIR